MLSIHFFHCFISFIRIQIPCFNIKCYRSSRLKDLDVSFSLLEHRFHDQPPAVKHRVPDLLSPGTGQFHCLYTGGIENPGNVYAVCFKQAPFLSEKNFLFPAKIGLFSYLSLISVVSISFYCTIFSLFCSKNWSMPHPHLKAECHGRKLLERNFRVPFPCNNVIAHSAA